MVAICVRMRRRMGKRMKERNVYIIGIGRINRNVRDGLSSGTSGSPRRPSAMQTALRVIKENYGLFRKERKINI